MVFGFNETLILVSTVSCFSSFLVIATYLYFTHLQNKLHFTLVFYISLCDFFANLGSSIGQPVNGTAGCWIQALLTTYFYTASLFWSTVVCYVLYSLVFYGDVTFNMSITSAICWITPLVVTLLPLVSVSYGRDDGATGWCYLLPGPNTSSLELVVWGFVTFYFWLGLSLVLMGTWGAMIYYRVRFINSQLAPVIIKALNKLKLYPVVIAVCWAFITFDQMVLQYSEGHHVSDITLSYASYIPAVLQGLFTSVIFFAKNKEIKRCWRSLFDGSTPAVVSTNSSGTNTEPIALSKTHSRNSLRYLADEDDEDGQYGGNMERASEGYQPNDSFCSASMSFSQAIGSRLSTAIVDNPIRANDRRVSNTGSGFEVEMSNL